MFLRNTIKFFRKTAVPIQPICIFSKRVNQNYLYRSSSTFNELHKSENFSYSDIQEAKTILEKIGYQSIDWRFSPDNEMTDGIRRLNPTKLVPIMLDHHPIKRLNILLREATNKNDMHAISNILSEVKSYSFKNHVLANVLPVTAKERSHRIAQLLIANGACVNERYGNSKSTWFYQDQINEDYEKSTGPTSLLLAAMFKNVELAQILIENKASINIQSNLLLPSDPEFHHYSEIAPLHYAAVNGDINMVNLLLKNGATVDIQNAFGETPLLFAVWKGHKQVVELLLNHKANPKVENNWGVPIWELTKNHAIRKLLSPELNAEKMVVNKQ
jgi:ankyrin repeat protein